MQDADNVLLVSDFSRQQGQTLPGEMFLRRMDVLFLAAVGDNRDADIFINNRKRFLKEIP